MPRCRAWGVPPEKDWTDQPLPHRAGLLPCLPFLARKLQPHPAHLRTGRSDHSQDLLSASRKRGATWSLPQPNKSPDWRGCLVGYPEPGQLSSSDKWAL